MDADRTATSSRVSTSAVRGSVGKLGLSYLPDANPEALELKPPKVLQADIERAFLDAMSIGRCAGSRSPWRPRPALLLSVLLGCSTGLLRPVLDASGSTEDRKAHAATEQSRAQRSIR